MTKNVGLTALPLGGVGECGSLNMMVYECDGDIIVVDAGIGFPNEYTPGIDVVVPDVTYIRENIDKVKGIFITHAHEDHIGALHYIWEDIPAKIYLTKFAKLVLDDKLASVGLEGKVPMHIFEAGDSIKLGNIEVEPVAIAHSVPEGNCLLIKTKYGNIVHTGDYKFEDITTIGGPENADENLKRVGDAGVLAMFGDCTSVAIKGSSGNEHEVEANMTKLFKGFEHRIFSTFVTSNIPRMHSIMAAAIANGRKIGIYGFSMKKRFQNAVDCNYIPKEFMQHIIDPLEAMQLPKEKSLLIVTGAIGQSRAALARMARGDLRGMEVEKDDMILHSSLWIPGNEANIAFMLSCLAYRGADIYHRYNLPGIYATGHPYEDDVVKMCKLLRPEIVVPILGDHFQMKTHANLAKKIGVPQQFTFVNGKKLHLAPGKPHIMEEQFPCGRNYIDGYNILDEDRFILRERIKMSETGVASVSMVVSKEDGEIISGPVIKTKGLIDEKIQPETINAARKEVFKTLNREFGSNKISRVERAEELTRQAVRRAFNRERGRKPVTVVSIIEV